MLQEIEDLRALIESDIAAIQSAEQLEAFRLKHLVRKGSLAEITQRFKQVPPADKPAIGKALNTVRELANSEFQRLKEELTFREQGISGCDVSLAGRKMRKGSAHPVTMVIDDWSRIFKQMGFEIADGPDIEDDRHNFEYLNFPDDHPARDMQDTFFVKGTPADRVLRTHTSPVQIRLMRSRKPPIRCIIPGRVYRNEAIDATHLAEFHQVEGLYVDRNVTFADLKGTLITFIERLFGTQDLKFRFRPSFFPFTEPSAEMDMLFTGSAKHRWVELGGCGMVHPNVLRNCGVDPEVYSGFAFGFGVERIAMRKHALDDIRLLYENDIRVLQSLS